MIRGTSAQFKFKLPYNATELYVVKIVFWQEHNNGPSNDRPLPIVKVLSQCDFTNDPMELSVTLNQEETLRFSDKRKAYVQLWGRTIDGVPVSTKERPISVYPIYDDTIVGDDVIPTPSEDEWVILDGFSIADVGGGF